jgi:hypothetical protein
MINRRTLLGSATAFCASPAWARKKGNLAERAWEAALFAFSIGETTRIAAAAPARNRLGHRRILSDHSHRGVTMPNNDTLYSSCWLDLGGNAHADLDLPTDAGRYISAAITGMDTDVIAIESSLGRDPIRRLRIVGPNWRGTTPSDRRLIRLPGADAWLLVRTAVTDAEDLLAAQAVQSRIGLSIVGAMPSEPLSLGNGEQAERLRSTVNAVLARTAPGSSLARRASAHRQFGLGTLSRPSADHEAAWRAAVSGLTAERIGDVFDHGRIVNGWLWPDASIARFGNNERFRAAIALSGLGALPESEATYFTAVQDSEGRPLQPGYAYRLDFSSPPPVEAFWSLSAYRGEADGRFFFVDNLIRRYSVRSTTPGLERGAVVIAAAVDPGPGAVWLPVNDGAFRLVLRAWRPAAALLDRKWLPPRIERMA